MGVREAARCKVRERKGVGREKLLLRAAVNDVIYSAPIKNCQVDLYAY